MKIIINKRKLIALLLCVCMIVSSCGIDDSYENKSINGSRSIGDESEINVQEDNDQNNDSDANDDSSAQNNAEPLYLDELSYEQEKIVWDEAAQNFSGLNDSEILNYVEDRTYYDVVNALNSDQYFVENIEAIYVSKEYIEELSFNSQSNIYFGYKLEDVLSTMGDKKFVFTLGDDGQTTVKEYEEYEDNFNQIITNLAIGTGVILVCVTVSALTVTGAPAVSMILACSAKSGAIMAVSSGAFGGLVAGTVTGIKTGDPIAALDAAALAGSESFKWGAITGVVTGGASEAIALKKATLNGLTMNEAALIQRETKYPLDLIKQFKSMDEYNVYKSAGLRTQVIDGKLALVRDIDLNYKSIGQDGKLVSNLELMQNGYAPIDPATGLQYQLHHVNQNPNGTLAILTQSEHQGNAAILNTIGKESEINRSAFANQRKDFWKDYAKQAMKMIGA